MLGALVGAVATGCAGVLTWWSLRWQQSAYVQAERDKWLREKQRATYADFLDAIQGAVDGLESAGRGLSAPTPDVSSLYSWLGEEVVTHVVSARRRLASVQIDGPASAEVAADELYRSVNTCMVVAMQWRQGLADDADGERLAELEVGFDETLQIVHGRLRNFTQVARDVVQGA
ncbi:hypothetical protein P2Q00_37140 [Streptomyces coacervatus]|nr:hypothetical protein [Streptomyces coacervatus]MDF2271012.1 hypothetical protein [Streptomyces coacervatus]